MKKIEKFQFGGTSTYTVNGITPPSKFEYVGDDSYKYAPDDRLFNPYQTQKIKAPELDTETLNKLAGKGHTNATNKVIGDAYKAKQMLEAGMASNPNYIYTEEGKSLMQRMTVSPQMLNELERDLKNTEDLRKAAEKNNSGSELAVSKEGKIVAKDNKGNIVEINPADYFTGSFTPLSITELLIEKDRNPNLTFANVSKYSDAITGFENAQKHVKDMFTNVGEYGFKNSNEAYTAMENALMKISKSGGNINNLKQVDARLESMMQTLPEQVKNNFLMRAMVNSKTPQEMQQNYIQGFLNHAKGVYTNKSESSQGINFDAGLTKFKLGRDTEVEVPKTDFFFDVQYETGKSKGQPTPIVDVTKPQSYDNKGRLLNDRSERTGMLHAIPENDDIKKQAGQRVGQTLSDLKGKQVMWGGHLIDIDKLPNAEKMLLVAAGNNVLREPDPTNPLNIQITAKQESIKEQIKSEERKGNQQAVQGLNLALQKLELAKIPVVYLEYKMAANSNDLSNNKGFQVYSDEEKKLIPAVGTFDYINGSNTPLFKKEENETINKMYEEKINNTWGSNLTGNTMTTTVYVKIPDAHYSDPVSIRTKYNEAIEFANNVSRQAQVGFLNQGRTPKIN